MCVEKSFRKRSNVLKFFGKDLPIERFGVQRKNIVRVISMRGAKEAVRVVVERKVDKVVSVEDIKVAKRTTKTIVTNKTIKFKKVEFTVRKLFANDANVISKLVEIFVSKFDERTPQIY